MHDIARLPRLARTQTLLPHFPSRERNRTVAFHNPFRYICSLAQRVFVDHIAFKEFVHNIAAD